MHAALVIPNAYLCRPKHIVFYTRLQKWRILVLKIGFEKYFFFNQLVFIDGEMLARQPSPTCFINYRDLASNSFENPLSSVEVMQPHCTTG